MDGAGICRCIDGCLCCRRCSLARTSYCAPVCVDGTTVGPRRALLERFLLEQSAREEFKALAPPEPRCCYDSEYCDRFDKPCFKPRLDQVKENEQLYSKYPLYRDGAITYWRCNPPYNKKGALRGFKRNGAFTKPLNDVYDENAYDIQIKKR